MSSARTSNLSKTGYSQQKENASLALIIYKNRLKIDKKKNLAVRPTIIKLIEKMQQKDITVDSYFC